MIKKTVFFTLLSLCSMARSSDQSFKPNYSKTDQWKTTMNDLLWQKMQQEGIRKENSNGARCIEFGHKMENGCDVGHACYILPSGLKVKFTVTPVTDSDVL